MHVLINNWGILKGDPLKISRVLFLCSFLLSTLCPMKSSCLGLTGHSAPSYNSERLLSYVSCTKPGNARWQARVFIGLTLFVSYLSVITVLCCLMSRVLKMVASYIVSGFLVVSGGECISGPCFSMLIRSLTSSFLTITYSPSNFLVYLHLLWPFFNFTGTSSSWSLSFAQSINTLPSSLSFLCTLDFMIHCFSNALANVFNFLTPLCSFSPAVYIVEIQYI